MLLIRLIDFVLSPLGFGLLLALLLWLGRTRLPRALWRSGLALEALCLVFATPLGGSALVGIEERRAPRPHRPRSWCLPAASGVRRTMRMTTAR